MIMTNLQIIISNLSYEMARYHITLHLCGIAVCVALLIFFFCFSKKKEKLVEEWGPLMFIPSIVAGIILVALIISLIGWLIAPVAATISCLCGAM